MAKTFKLTEAIELLKAITEYRSNSLNCEPEIAQRVQRKLLDEVQLTFSHFQIQIHEEARRDDEGAHRDQ